MQFSEQWLRRYANPAIGSEELAHRLTMSGLEVEESVPVAPPFTGIVVAHVVAVAKHPNADKLTVCEVDAGTGCRAHWKARSCRATSASSARPCAGWSPRACCARPANSACRRTTAAC